MAKKPLTDEQKIEILRRDAQNQSIEEIKREMGIENGQQIAGVLSSQYTKSGAYLLKKAGLPGPTRPPHKPRSDVHEGGGEKRIEDAGLVIPEPKPVQPDSQQQAQAPVLPAVTVPTSLGPVATGGSEPVRRPLGPAPVTQASNILGFKRDGVSEKIVVYREAPWSAQIASYTPPFDITEIGPKFGDGEYRIERWIPGRMQPEVMRLPVQGYGPPRTPSYEGTGMNNGTPVEPPSAMANVVVNAMKAGADLVKQEKPTAAPSPLEKATEKLVEKAVEQVMVPATPPPATSFSWQDYMKIREEERKIERQEEERRQREREERDRRDREEREAQYRREREEREIAWKREREERETQRLREREEREAEHRRRLEEAEKRHEQEMARLRAEAELRQKELHEQQALREKFQHERDEELAKLSQQKVEWAMKEQRKVVEEAQSAVQQAEENLSKKIEELNKTAEAERARDREELKKEREHLEKMLEKEREMLRVQKEFQEQLIELKKLSSNANEGELVKLGGKLLDAFNERAKDVLEVKKAEAVLNNNQGLVTDVMKNPQLMRQIAAGQPSGDKEMTSKIDAAASTQEFKDFLEEWSLHVEDNLDPEVLFDSIQRRYQQNEPGVGELVDFISGRRWEKAKFMIEKYFTPGQKTIFGSEYATKYYEKMRSLIVLMKQGAMKQWAKWEMERSGTAVPAPTEQPMPVEQTAAEQTDVEEPKQ